MANGSYENYLQYFEDDRQLFDSFRDKLYKFTQRLFQNYLDCFVNKDADGNPVSEHKSIDFELKPLVAELRLQYYNTRQRTTKHSYSVSSSYGYSKALVCTKLQELVHAAA